MRQNIQVPFGYEPPEQTVKGTLIYYDSFEETTDEELLRAVEVAKERSFRQLVLYPLHEESVKRMTKEQVSPYFKRADRLHDWRRDQGQVVTVEGLEGKRKKYTPLDTALRHLTEKYPSPYFLYLDPNMANLLASFSSFEEWIVKLRLLISEESAELHPRLEKFRHRIDFV